MLKIISEYHFVVDYYKYKYKRGVLCECVCRSLLQIMCAVDRSQKDGGGQDSEDKVEGGKLKITKSHAA